MFKNTVGLARVISGGSALVADPMRMESGGSPGNPNATGGGRLQGDLVDRCSVTDSRDCLAAVATRGQHDGRQIPRNLPIHGGIRMPGPKHVAVLAR
jgi:hypothetical protein